MGRLLSRTYPDASVVSFTYTPDGNRATATDARGTTTYAYDNRRRVVQVTYPDGRALAYGYDARGGQTSLTAKIGATVLTTTTSYDADGRVSSVTDPLARTFTMGYDRDGNRTSAAYPNGTSTTYAYDVRDRLTGITTLAGSTAVQSFAYMLDRAGRRTQETDGDGTVRAYGYDGIDRLTSEVVTGSLAYAKAFTYDAVGNRGTQTTTGAGAGSVTYAYDVRDRLLTENATSYAYDANGNVISKSGEAIYGWDFDNRLVSAAMANGTTVNHAYDVDGNRVQTRVTPQVQGGSGSCQGNTAVFVKEDITTQGSWQGTYGADGQYINAETPSAPSYGSVTFTNASSYTWNASTPDVRALQAPPPGTARIASTYYSATSETFHVVTTDNQPHTIAFYLLDWDNNGRAQTITAQDASATVFDSARPFGNFGGGVYAVYQVCGSVDFVFAHTAGLNAVVSGVFFGPPQQTHAGAAATTNMLVDAAGGLSQVVAETDGTGVLTAYYVRAGDELVSVMRPGSTPGTWTSRFVHHDGLGSIRTLTDESGTTMDTRAYEAFGTKNVEAGSDPLAYGFAGEPFEGTSALAYHRARWMDARVGRFEGVDPFPHEAANDALANFYSYASENPVTVTDPSGQIDSLISISVAVAIAGLISADVSLSPRSIVLGYNPSAAPPTFVPNPLPRSVREYLAPFFVGEPVMLNLINVKFEPVCHDQSGYFEPSSDLLPTGGATIHLCRNWIARTRPQPPRDQWSGAYQVSIAAHEIEHVAQFISNPVGFEANRKMFGDKPLNPNEIGATQKQSDVFYDFAFRADHGHVPTGSY